MLTGGKLLASLVLVLVLLPSASAGYWAKFYGGSGWEYFHSVTELSNGDIIIAGKTNSFGAGKYDILILRLDAEGNIKWQKTYGGRNDDEVFSIAEAANGDIIVAAGTESFGAGDYDFWILRLDADGNIKWQKTYGGAKRDEAMSLVEAANGDIIVVGAAYSFGSGLEDEAWILRLDADGNIKWQKTYGGAKRDAFCAVREASNGDIIVAGVTWSFGAGKGDFWVLRLDAEGKIKWQKTYGGAEFEVAWSLVEATNGDIIVAGVTYSFGEGQKFWVLRLDAEGKIKWQKTYGGAENDWLWEMVEASNGDIIVAGVTESFGAGDYDAWILRLDAEGKIKWQKTYGGAKRDGALAMVEASNGDIIVAGVTESFGAGDKNAWILKLPSDGSLEYFSQDSHAILNDTNAQSNNSNASILAPSVQVNNSQALVEDLNLPLVLITPTEKMPRRGKGVPGFEAVFTLTIMLSAAYLLRKTY
ncbi:MULTISPECIES: PGF-CTERM sorting domain-containing protein [unclassified Archaeoglobus]|jgi:uncharacterized delta-60 repeat protein|uniref:PGF-CTERM sorting domain-containing protein n=1 Tax=unclassified Archaeoglobus TaxID=2643606 RepID=UPI0025C6E1B2|nr:MULTISPECIES: PGF-CTERM sorting domain-containing protein [unclassified Archaeoglobus]